MKTLSVILLSILVSNSAMAGDSTQKWYKTLAELAQDNSGSSGLGFQFSTSCDLDPMCEYDGLYYFQSSTDVNYILNIVRPVCYVGNPAEVSFVELEGEVIASNPPIFRTFKMKTNADSENETLQYNLIEENRYFNGKRPQKRPFYVEEYKSVTLSKCK